MAERLLPSNLFNGSASPAMIFALASILRFRPAPTPSRTRSHRPLPLRRYLTPVSAAGVNVFVGRLDRSLPDDQAHASVPNLQAQGSGYTFVDGSGVAQRLLGNFGAEREVQEAAVVDALKVCFAPSVDSNFENAFPFPFLFPCAA